MWHHSVIWRRRTHGFSLSHSIFTIIHILHLFLVTSSLHSISAVSAANMELQQNAPKEIPPQMRKPSNQSVLVFGQRVPKDPKQKPNALPVETNYISSERQFGLQKYANHKFFVWHSARPMIGSVWPHPEVMRQDRKQVWQLLYADQHFTIDISVRSKGTAGQTLSPILEFIKSFHGYAVNTSIINAAADRLRNKLSTASGILHITEEEAKYLELQSAKTFITKINVIINKSPTAEEWPHLYMDETYSLKQEKTALVIEANEIWGALHGLETLAQLLFMTPDKLVFLFSTYIEDRPRFPHRGLLIDTARHYIPMRTLMRNLDAMAMNKLNVFHWHLSDDQSFPFKGIRMPEMAEKGAFTRTRIYTVKDVQAVVHYARQRGIRVIPEFDVPSHTLSWAKSKNILAECYDQLRPTGFYGPIDPTLKETYSVLKNLYLDVQSLFPEEYLHLGADEVDTTCWMTNPEISSYLNQLKQMNENSTPLQLFFKKLHGIIRENSRALNEKKDRRFIIWQEGWEQKLPLPKNETIVQLWMKNPVESLALAREGWKIVFSTCYYLDRPVYGADWTQYYGCDLETSYPLQPSPNLWQSNVLGGEACMWNEYQTDLSMMQRVWPSASAVAEKLWSLGLLSTVDQAAPRLEAQRCRMLSSGIQTGVGSGPGECTEHPDSNSKDFINRLELENIAFEVRKITLTDCLVCSSNFFYPFIISLFLFLLYIYSHQRKLSLPQTWVTYRRQMNVSHRGAFYLVVVTCLGGVVYSVAYITG